MKQPVRTLPLSWRALLARTLQLHLRIAVRLASPLRHAL
jgi:hypothetical protein